MLRILPDMGARGLMWQKRIRGIRLADGETDLTDEAGKALKIEPFRKGSRQARKRSPGLIPFLTGQMAGCPV